MSNTNDDPRPSDTSKQAIVREAKKRFKLAQDWEAVARQRFIEDVKFVNGDSDNLYQWPVGIRNSRGYGTGDERPCLTVNKTAQHCLQIINDARQNKTSVKIKPVGNEATYEAAQVMEGIVRHIEYISDAQSAYAHATKYQVWGGIGFWRVMTDYIDDVTMDQDIFIRRIKDPLTVYLDPDYTHADGSDMRYAFVFEDVPRDEFEIQFPDAPLPSEGATSTLSNADGWITDKHVRVAEYFWRTEKPDKLIAFKNPETGAVQIIKLSDTKGFSGALKDALDEQLADPATKTRDVIGHEVKWVKIAGDHIVDEDVWAGDTIPIVFCLGQQTVIDGELDRKGHVRALKDAQRMFNYNASAAIEYGALQGKQPWVAPAKAIEGYETFWETANVQNYSVLPWNHRDDDGNEVPGPVRSPPPMGAPLYQEGMANSANDMMLVSGQYQADMGAPSNERSGKAITARQRQGENATYHFIDHLATAIRRTGKIIIQLIPIIYDTPRVVKILGDDGADSDVYLDPKAAKAYEERKAETEQTAAKVVMNPTIGRYDVMSDVGPDYATRRQEAFNALSQIAASNPELMSVIGDLVMLAADFPLADEAAERLKRMVPAQALGDGPNPQVVALQGELSSTQALMASMSAKLMALQSKTTAVGEQKAIDVYKAFTDRLDVFLKYTQVPASDIAAMQKELAMQEHGADLTLRHAMLTETAAGEA